MKIATLLLSCAIVTGAVAQAPPIIRSPFTTNNLGAGSVGLFLSSDGSKPIWAVPPGASGGDNVLVNGTDVSNPNFTNTTQVTWTVSGTNVSASLVLTNADNFYILNNVSQLASIAGSGTKTNAWVNGYSTPGDGGAGWWWWSPDGLGLSIVGLVSIQTGGSGYQMAPATFEKVASGTGYTTGPATMTIGGIAVDVHVVASGGAITSILATNTQPYTTTTDYSTVNVVQTGGSGGTGYAKTYTSLVRNVAGGTGSAAQVTISAITSGVITSVRVTSAGNYSVLPGTVYDAYRRSVTIEVIGSESTPTLVVWGNGLGGMSVAGASGAWHRLRTSPVNARFFGAKGDGTTDDTGALQAAINYCATFMDDRDGIGALYVPAGKYIVNGTLNLTPPSVNYPIRIIGDGWKETKIQHDTNDGLPAFAVTNVMGITLENIALGGATTRPSSTRNTAFKAEQATQITMRNVRLTQAGYGVYLLTGNRGDHHLDNVLIEICGKAGYIYGLQASESSIRLDSNADSLDFYNCNGMILRFPIIENGYAGTNHAVRLGNGVINSRIEFGYGEAGHPILYAGYDASNPVRNLSISAITGFGQNGCIIDYATDIDIDGAAMGTTGGGAPYVTPNARNVKIRHLYNATYSQDGVGNMADDNCVMYRPLNYVLDGQLIWGTNTFTSWADLGTPTVNVSTTSRGPGYSICITNSTGALTWCGRLFQIPSSHASALAGRKAVIALWLYSGSANTGWSIASYRIGTTTYYMDSYGAGRPNRHGYWSRCFATVDVPIGTTTIMIGAVMYNSSLGDFILIDDLYVGDAAAAVDHVNNGLWTPYRPTDFVSFGDSGVTNINGRLSLGNIRVNDVAYTWPSANALGALQNNGSGTLTWTPLPIEIGLACSDETTPLTTGTSKVTFRAPRGFIITGARATLTTAQASGSPLVTVDINKNGTSIFTTVITIDNTEKTSYTAATPCVLNSSQTTVNDDDEFTVDVDGVASGTTATGLKVWLIGTRL